MKSKSDKITISLSALYGAKPLKTGQCCFPLWKDGEKPTHKYCRKPVAPDRKMCILHQATCYIRIKPRIKEAKTIDELFPSIQKCR